MISSCLDQIWSKSKNETLCLKVPWIVATCPRTRKENFTTWPSKKKNLASLAKKKFKFFYQIFRKKSENTRAWHRLPPNLSWKCYFFWPRTSIEIFFPSPRTGRIDSRYLPRIQKKSLNFEFSKYWAQWSGLDIFDPGDIFTDIIQVENKMRRWIRIWREN